MTLMIYNSLSRKKEKFVPMEQGKVKMYVCGMTVYSNAHVGHARTYYAFDVIRRYFQYKEYQVSYVQNITDVDDKIIDAANKEGIDALEYSKGFTEKCLNDLDKLGIRRADKYPRASETISDMINMIDEIINNDFAYEVNGDVYFSVEDFSDYGKLSGQKVEDMKAGARIEPDKSKRSPLDFALWKKAKPGEPSWDSPWGKGRPGWHIECSTMSSKFLGLPFDIHGGGMDLRFPHHENEIAQAEAAYGIQFARYWMHVGLLTVDGEKMSKSLGNIVNIKDLIEKWDPEIIRFFFSQTHYRSPPDFNEKSLENAQKGLDRIYRVKEKLEDLTKDKDIKMDKTTFQDADSEYSHLVNKFKEDFEEAMDDDFNTPRAVAVIFDFVNKSNSYLESVSQANPALCKYALDMLVRLGNILTLFQGEKTIDNRVSNEEDISDKLKNLAAHFGKKAEKQDIPYLMDLLLQAREEAREKQNWGTADDIRDELEKIGFEIQDTQNGPEWRKR